MGKTKGRPRKNDLVDMSIIPEQRTYSPPPPEACEETTVPIRLPEPGHELRVRCAMYRGQVVDFAIIQIARVDGDWVNVAKIDCDRGVVHRHQYERDTGVDLWDHRPLCEIPPDHGWEVVDRWYDEALQMMEDEWEDNLRRWNGDAA
ncbi:hypothetical protein Daura_43555 [Dactylosporangium aurantiacum]|uniref:DUF7718 domain-containing protein n=1 Tax=Dactylosporangium aurantiacum TaxID=35754 RepID=A0A9Q9IH92_9ACTN|nr:hypothetical protein [Dactylosporangium aurantiacum]MDG6102342.1 hypothetical protein [Dactylosporangium aurantiacum]UWZ53359.1 hypothetical protein Daura_43555 [Dactylosporangium aurantiacum]